MKILIDVRLLNKGRTSGIEEYTRFLINQLLTIDQKNEYVFFNNGLRKTNPSVDWFKFKNPSFVNWRIPNKIFDLSLKFLKEPELDRFIDFDLVFSPHFNLLRLGKNKKRVVTFHDLSFIHFPEFYPWRKRYWHWTQDCKNQAKEATKLITVSEFTKTDLVEVFGIEPNKIEVIYSGINPIYSKLLGNDEGLKIFQKRNNLQRPFLLFVGVIEPRKNIDAIIRAFDIIKDKPKFHDLELIIVGEQGWLYKKIIEKINSSKARENIRMWGAASYDELRYLYNLATVFVYPSIFEGFGFPPLEAQTCGAPVVASNRSSLPEILGESALFVDPWRINEFVVAIESLLENRGLSEKLIKKGFENIKRFNWAKTAHRVLEIFETLK
ncbi:MAG: glycosyltransferase family 1 protein [Patescibacteria group bacterium]|nr:glycosyltransferase family 1 protein [Patescibacteria group bacterium]